jgi:ATP-dependent DNA helicase RecG
MATSFQTLVKILQLEQQKEFQNRSVIGGLGRFSFHWAKEAHGRARSDGEHSLIDQVAELLRQYDGLDEQQRPPVIDQIINLSSQHAAAPEAPRAPKGKSSHRVEGSSEQGEADLFQDEEFLAPETGVDQVPVAIAAPASVRERRGYAWKEQLAPSEETLRRLREPIRRLKGIGEKRGELFEKIGVHTVGDLIRKFPRRYDDYSNMKLIRHLKVNEDVTVIGVLNRISVQRTKHGTSRVEAYLEDDSGSLRLNWFNQTWVEKRLKEGMPVAASGKIEQYLGRLVMNSPELEPVDQEWLQAGRIVPVYSLTKGLTNRIIRSMTKRLLTTISPRLPDYLPLPVREGADLMDYGDAVSQAHFPDSQEDKKAALLRLSFDEVFCLHIAMLRQRYDWQRRSGVAMPVNENWLQDFQGRLPYQLTRAQEQAVQDISRDMSSDVPMNRLLQGDVGSGKTIISAVAMAIAVSHNAQAVLMAPTSILAEQHYTNISELFSSHLGYDQIKLALLTGNSSATERDEIYAGLADGSIHIVIGTHALIQPAVEFARLGLAVIDEQHRFGVVQRGALREKAGGGNPHLLVMTATPIPRTLALTLHADLDLTVIDEMPPGRMPVQTKVIQPKERERAYAFIKSQIQKGHQAFIVYPLVDDSDKLAAKSAKAEHKRLSTSVFPDLKLGLLHGKMKPDEKDTVMDLFYRGETSILVSTSVIEVGIDVPNATVILVENANRFGLAQLHQLRGRVGRGGAESYCLLVSDKSFIDDDDRLSVVAETTDGFKLAQADWEMRGAGDLFGIKQSGFGKLDFARLVDPHLVDLVQREARAIYEKDPELTLPEHQALARRVARTGVTGDVS